MNVQAAWHGGQDGGDGGHCGVRQVCEGGRGAGRAHGGVGNLRGGSGRCSSGHGRPVRGLVHTCVLLTQEVSSELGPSVLEPDLQTETANDVMLRG